ncbi:hypothetical protein [Methanohalophilus sp.]|uniref:hypothetical protein n=1 Tax=Methanohalophilus sp. TaxID=1966352 RepID=UPI002627AC78|nr:hypothetical protein [Methanohalophilus sp.]
MKKTANLLLAGAVLLAGAGMVALTLQTQDVQAAYGYGVGWGVCPGYGAGYNQGYSTNSDLNVESVDDAHDIAKDKINPDVIEENIYQMGRWWVVYYTNDDGVVTQSYIDAFTGEVTDNPHTYQAYDYAPARYGQGYGGMGYGMMHGYGYGPRMMGYGGGGIYR